MEPSYSNPFAAPETDARSGRGPVDAQNAMLAERSTRLVAKILDHFLASLTFVPGIVVLAMTDFESFVGWTLLVVLYLALFVYQTVLTATTGQTLAKRWLNVRIVRLDGSPADFLSAVLLRSWLMSLLDMFLFPIISLIDVVMIFDDSRQCLHDRIAGTKVVDVAGDRGTIA